MTKQYISKEEDDGKTYFVYTHRKKTTGEVFYVGKGLSNRPWKMTGRSEAWEKIAKTHGVTVEIVGRFIIDTQAIEEETRIINEYGIDALCNVRSMKRPKLKLENDNRRVGKVEEFKDETKTFSHRNGDTFTGTAFEFSLKSKVKLAEVLGLVKGYRKNLYGWIVK